MKNKRRSMIKIQKTKNERRPKKIKKRKKNQRKRPQKKSINIIEEK